MSGSAEVGSAVENTEVAIAVEKKRTGEAPGQSSVGRNKAEHDHKSVDAAKPLRILLTEDNKVNQKLASALLRKMGHQVFVANDGAEAVSKWSEAELDMIFMDIHMPGMNGFQATRTIRGKEQATGKRTPIIALTAYTTTDAREHCLAAEMDDYIPKPVNRAALQAAITRCYPVRAK
jgi:two-component system, sensor histidine kinase and response regulator